MCGRYSQTFELAEAIKRFSLKPPPFNCKPSYNIAPGAMSPVVCVGGMKLLKWGFVPSWAAPKNSSGSVSAPNNPARLPLFSAGNPLESKFAASETAGPPENGPDREGFINARAEGIASRPVFRNAFYKSRCLVPCDGFYEWHSSAGAKIPYRFEMRDKGLFAMAGVYEEATGTYAVITAAANALVRAIHHRMPVIIEKRHEALWLDPKMKDTETLLPLLRGYDSSLMHGYRVSDLINDPKNDSPDCLKPF
ncbi:MAG: SOS response-associated peptidase [Elusimicrobia bacterium]|nr:SOS response-associated peptidase [Elusimicrobiota bacterium]